ncbi:MAG: DUF5939 domain-containing protein [Leptospira sp.]|nr:DUF5939 domain-containing protein [Leptospira sp.]
MNLSRNQGPGLQEIAKSESVIRSRADYSLFRINPIRFATEKAIAENETIDLFLWATKAGLFSMDWILICPRCAATPSKVQNLAKRLFPFLLSSP